ncbi:MAG: hypothetical protein ACRCTZ_12980 [Sarcina sp.]
MRDKNLTQNCNKEIEKEVTQIISIFTIEQTVAAEEMTREEYVTSRGWELPEDEKHLKDEKVFKIYNEEGHISMLPKDLFLKIAKEIKQEIVSKTERPEQMTRYIQVAEIERLKLKLKIKKIKDLYTQLDLILDKVDDEFEELKLMEIYGDEIEKERDELQAMLDEVFEEKKSSLSDMSGLKAKALRERKIRLLTNELLKMRDEKI